MTVSSGRFVLLVSIAATLIRICFTLAYRGSLDVLPVHSIAGADSVEYDLLARQMAAGHGYSWSDGTPTSFRAPGLSLFLAVLYACFGVKYTLAYISFAVMGGFTAISTYYLARELMDERRGRFAAVLAAIYPPDVYNCSFFFSEALFPSLLGGGLYFLARGSRVNSVLMIALAGILLGLATLTRSFGLLFLPIFGLWLLGNPLSRRNWIMAIAFGVGFLSPVLMWTARNYQVHGKVVLVATNGGSTFYGANNDYVIQSYRDYGNWVSTTKLEGRDLIDAQPDEVSHDKMEWQLGVKWVREHPTKFAILGVFKAIRYWLPFIHYPSLKVYPVANILCTAPFLFAILVGILGTLKTTVSLKQYMLLHLTMLANLIMVTIFWGDPRFRDANTPVLMCYFVLGFDLLQRLVKKSPQS